MGKRRQASPELLLMSTPPSLYFVWRTDRNTTVSHRNFTAFVSAACVRRFGLQTSFVHENI